MLLNCLLFALAQSFNTDYVLIIYSNETSLELLNEFSEYDRKLHIECDWDSKINDVRLLVDITENALYFDKLESASIFFHSKYLTLSSDCNHCFSQNRYLANPSKKSESAIISNLVSFLGWNSVSLISDDSSE